MHADGDDPWMAAMQRGDFEAAWAISDRILAQRISSGGFDFTLPRHRQAIWDGRPLAGKHVLVRCYHGLGDTIQFIRFAKPLRAIAREVSVWVQPPLMNLVAQVEGVDRVLPLHDGAPDLAYDVDIEVMELAHALRATPATIAKDVPYIHPPAHPVPLPDGGLRIGLVWAVSGAWMPERSLHFSALAPLLALPGIVPVVLQRGPPACEAEGCSVHDAGDDNVDVFAATLAALDMLVTIDTFAAHLAGAMRVPVRLMLPHRCDWRWASTATRSAWYPSLRIYRQPRAGDWSAVVRAIAHDFAGTSALGVSPEQTQRCDVRPV